MDRMSRTELLREIQSRLHKIDHDNRSDTRRHRCPQCGSTDSSSAEDDERTIFRWFEDVEDCSCARLESTAEW